MHFGSTKWIVIAVQYRHITTILALTSVLGPLLVRAPGKYPHLPPLSGPEYRYLILSTIILHQVTLKLLKTAHLLNNNNLIKGAVSMVINLSLLYRVYGHCSVYMEKLLALEAASPSVLSQRVEGFLLIMEWELYLSSYPDQRLAAFQYGFRIGFDPTQPAVEPASSCQNHNSVVYNPEVASTYIAGEVDQGKLALCLDSHAG